MSKSQYRLRRILAISAIISVAAALKLISDVATIEGFSLRIYDIPLMLGGIILGPYYGFLSGFVVDFIYFLLSPYAIAFPTLFTAGSMLWGGVAGVVFYRRKPRLRTLAPVVVVTSLLVFALNSAALYGDFPTALGLHPLPMIIPRIVRTPLLWPLQIAAVLYLNERVGPELARVVEKR